MHPPVFSNLSFDEALAKAKDTKLLLVDATASWCQPCKHMDKTTWVDAKVAAAIKEHGLAIQFDVDEHKELAKKLRVRAMPTVIAFRHGKELDRIVGARAPGAFVAWVEALSRGETSLDMARRAARDNPTSPEARVGLSRALLQAGAFDEATTEHLWVWEHILEQAPAFVGAKHSFFLQQIVELVTHHAPAREAFRRLRDATPPATLDWFSLNKALGDDAKTLAWFETVKDNLASDPTLAKRVETGVIPLLVAAGRWAEAGKAYANPVKTLDAIIEHAKRTEALAIKLPAEQGHQARAEFQKLHVQEVAVLRRALAEAGRVHELRAVEAAAASFDPSWIVASAK
jgi:thioredoxin-like negative regulator of GroEL